MRRLLALLVFVIGAILVVNTFMGLQPASTPERRGQSTTPRQQETTESTTAPQIVHEELTPEGLPVEAYSLLFEEIPPKDFHRDAWGGYFAEPVRIGLSEDDSRAKKKDEECMARPKTTTSVCIPVMKALGMYYAGLQNLSRSQEDRIVDFLWEHGYLEQDGNWELYTDALKEHMFQPVYFWGSGTVYVKVGKRELNSIDNVAKSSVDLTWITGQPDTVALWTVRFTYRVETTLPNFPTTDETFQGMARVYKDPASLRWKPLAVAIPMGSDYKFNEAYGLIKELP